MRYALHRYRCLGLAKAHTVTRGDLLDLVPATPDEAKVIHNRPPPDSVLGAELDLGPCVVGVSGFCMHGPSPAVVWSAYSPLSLGVPFEDLSGDVRSWLP